MSNIFQLAGSVLIVNLFLTSLVVLGVIGMGLSYGLHSGYQVATMEWSQASYSGFEGTKANVTVVDPDMNKYPNAIDYLWISLHSDSDPDLTGTRMTLFETNFDSGIFQREITFTKTPPSGGGFLHVVTGDSIYAKYVDTTYPANFSATDLRRISVTEQGLEVTASSIIVGKRGPPLERAPAFNLTLFTLSREPIQDNTIVIDQQVRIAAYLENQQNKTQPFAYLVQIQNAQEQVESLSWITGNLTSFQKLNPNVTWIPFQEGMYRATAFVWESVYNPTALSPPLSLEIIVKDVDEKCREGQVEIMPNGCFLLTDVVFGDTSKRSKQGWKIYPGGAGWRPPANSTLTYIPKEVKVGVPPLDLTAMLNDKIFVDKCESHGGTWNTEYTDCEGISEICVNVGGIKISRDITLSSCTEEICLPLQFNRISCVFEYEN